jgi:hypothetical protein
MVVKPSAGTAETRQRAPSPKSSVTCPPTDWIVCVPAPPGQLAALLELADAPGCCGAVVWWEGCGADGEGERRDEEGEARPLAAAVAVPVACGREEDTANTVGIACAVGGSGVVERTTKRTVRETAATVSVVQDIQTRK